MSKSKRTKIIDILDGDQLGSTVVVKGWVRTKRDSKNVVFIALNDGSVMRNLQIVVNNGSISEEVLARINTGACLSITGEVISSEGKGQAVELSAQAIQVLGEADPEKFPLQPKRHSLEFLREIAHLRPRTNTFGAIYRIRHAMIFAVHQFFTDKGFLNIHTPIITASDAEGAGETFMVTNFDMEKPPRGEDGQIDFNQDFFGKKTNLTVSGQLEGELAALAMSDIYTFGPCFRAENSNTSRHLAEFWMIEPEMAFYDLTDTMDLAEEFVRYLVKYALQHCEEDLAFLNKRAEDEDKNKKQEDRRPMSLLESLQFVADHDFERITYTEAIQILKNSKPNKKKRFQFLIEDWGTDLQSEHERYLVEKHFKKPVIIHDYPANIKAFYMRVNEDGKTVAAMDVLFPGIGEIIGGSQREEQYDQLTGKMEKMGIHAADLQWYLDTRRFGTAPHSGFGLGFERFMQFVTGMHNIRDVIPFPRARGSAEF